MTERLLRPLSRLVEPEAVYHPAPSFMSNARELADTWPEIFRVDPKLLPYDDCRRIAVCNLPLEDRNRLRAWAEAVEPKRSVLSALIPKASKITPLH